jgi:hypothetical protein
MDERHRENVLDQSLADTFPASDPVSITQPGGGGNLPVRQQHLGGERVEQSREYPPESPDRKLVAGARAKRRTDDAADDEGQ